MGVQDQMEIKVHDIGVVGNFRKRFDEGKMGELIASVREFGVLEPILVRNNVDGDVEKLGNYLLIAGERRLRAAKEAGLKTIPARVMDVDEKAAAEIQLLENLHREDLGPIEEARAFETLLAQGAHTVETLAERVDKSVAYVYRSIRLTDLPAEALEAIEQGKLTPAHGHQILRAPDEKQVEITLYALEQAQHRIFPAWELRQHMEFKYAANLSEAIFPKGRPYAGEVACSACPYNSGNQGQLFDGAEKGTCSNPECFKKKTGTFLEDYSKASAADYPGLQYLGVQAADYTGGIEGMKRARLLGGTLPRETAKVAKEKPEKFGWCVLTPRGRGEKPTTAMVCLDPKILAGTEGPALRAAEGRKGPGRDAEEYIHAAVQQALVEAVAETIPPRSRFDFTEAQWALIQRNGVRPADIKMEPCPDRINAQEILVRAVTDDEDLKALGINADKVRAAAIKAAEKKWAQIQAEKKESDHADKK